MCDKFTSFEVFQLDNVIRRPSFYDYLYEHEPLFGKIFTDHEIAYHKFEFERKNYLSNLSLFERCYRPQALFDQLKTFFKPNNTAEDAWKEIRKDESLYREFRLLLDLGDLHNYYFPEYDRNYSELILQNETSPKWFLRDCSWNQRPGANIAQECYYTLSYVRKTSVIIHENLKFENNYGWTMHINKTDFVHYPSFIELLEDIMVGRNLKF